MSLHTLTTADLRGLHVQVMIWDDHAGRCIGELSFRSQVCSVCCAASVPQSPYSASIATQVRAVRLRRDRIVVALEHKVLVYNFADLKLLSQIETLSNEKGLISISSANESTVLACPGLHTGEVQNTPSQALCALPAELFTPLLRCAWSCTTGGKPSSSRPTTGRSRASASR
jgi:hypothetical protein